MSVPDNEMKSSDGEVAPSNETRGGTGDDCSVGKRGVWPHHDGQVYAQRSNVENQNPDVTAGETALNSPTPSSAPRSLASHNSGEKLPNGDTAGCGAETNSPAALGPAMATIPLSDHGEIGRMVLCQPWEIQKQIVTIAAHCAVLADPGEHDSIADLAGCISQCCFDLAKALSDPTPAPVDAGVRGALKFYADPFAWKKKHDPDDVVRIPDFYSETSFGDTAVEALVALASSQPVFDREKIARTMCKSKTCEGFACCQWPGSMGRTNCPVKNGGYDDAADSILSLIRRGK